MELTLTHSSHFCKFIAIMGSLFYCACHLAIYRLLPKVISQWYIVCGRKYSV